MSDQAGSYEAKPTDPIEPLSFGGAVFRGVGVANKLLLGALLILAIIGPMQLASSVSGALAIQGGGFQPPAEGEPPPVELFLMMGLGCFTCAWFLVLIFGLPWAGGGIYGQANDHLTSKPVGSFAQYGKQFYTRLLLLTVIYFGVVLVLMIPMWAIGAAITAGQIQSGEFDPEKMQELGQHPLNIAAGVVFGLALTALGMIMVLTQGILVVTDCRTMEAISGAFRYIGQHFTDAVKLFLVFVLTGIPIIVLQQAPNLLPDVTVPVMAVVGGLSGIYLAYVSVLNAGIGLSVYIARQSAKQAEPS